MKEKENSIVKNPLGIIALFITSIYGIAGLVMGPNFDNLQGNCERQPIIWYFILFPIVILGVFTYLVIKHNEKLYSPKDFDNQDGFLIANGKTLLPHKDSQPLSNPEMIPLKKKANSCFCVYGKKDNAKSCYSLIEEASMKRYADEHDMEIKTDVRISRDLTCDGLAEKDGKLYIFEVKSNYSPSQCSHIIRWLSCVKSTLNEMTDKELCIIIIIVSDKKLEDKNLEGMKTQLKSIMPQVEVINYLTHDIKNSVDNATRK